MPRPAKTLWNRISRNEAVEAGLDYYFDSTSADYAVGFFETFLFHTKGKFAGKPFTLMRWQREDIIEELFGWKRVADDTRRFRVGYIEIPKKNGKSTLMSGMGLMLMLADSEPSAEVYIAANSRDQAGIVYRSMAEMVRASPYLRSKLSVIDSRKNISYAPSNSFARVIASESAQAEGLNIHALIYDEIHATKDRRLWEAVRYGGISRSQPLLCAITTAGAERSGLCWEQHEYAEKVIADPAYDPQFFAYIAAAEPDDDWKSPEVWAAANPSFGETMDATSFEADVKEAEQSSSKLAAFKRYRLNLWSQGENKFLDMEQFKTCCEPLLNVTSERVWYAGLDLAQTWDCNAFVAVSRGHDDVFDVMCRFWIPGDNAHKRSVADNVPYVEWNKDPKTGLCLTPGDVCDYEFIKRDILKFCKEQTVRRIAVDPHNSHYLVQQLQAEGLDVVGFSQGFSSMNAGCKLVETTVAQSRLRTGGNKVLTWMAGNATVKQNADGYIKIVKPSPNSSARVDGIIALAMALAMAEEDATRPPPPAPEIFVL